MRGAAAALLVLVATLLTPLGVTATWVSSTIDSTGSYVETVAPLADDDALRAELADAATAAAVAALRTHVPVGLPDGVETTVRVAAVTVTESEDFPALWRQANRDAHRDFLAVMERDASDAWDGWVEVDLSPMLQQVYDRVAEAGIPVQLLPQPELSVPVVRRSQLAEHRGEYRLVEGAAIGVPLVWAALVGIGVLVATGRRGRLRTLGFAGLGLAFGALLVRVAAGPAADLAVGRSGAGQRDLVALVADVVLDALASASQLVALVAGVAGVLLLVAGGRFGRSASPYPAGP